MSRIRNQLTVFTKPWPEMPLAELGRLVKGMGFDGVELPVRPGYQVTPEDAAGRLPEAHRILQDQGVKIGTVAATADRDIIAACGEAGVPVVRIMVDVDPRVGYYETEKRTRERFDSLLPLLEESGVVLGVQNHCGNMIGSAIGLMHLIEGYDPGRVGAVLDLAHCGLVGEPEDMAIDICWSHLLLLNLKSAYWVRSAGPEVRDAPWRVYWTAGGHGIVSWRAAVRELRRRRYDGDICLTAEYSIPPDAAGPRGEIVGAYLRRDLEYLRELFVEEEPG